MVSGEFMICDGSKIVITVPRSGRGASTRILRNTPKQTYTDTGRNETSGRVFAVRVCTGHACASARPTPRLGPCRRRRRRSRVKPAAPRCN